MNSPQDENGRDMMDDNVLPNAFRQQGQIMSRTKDGLEQIVGKTIAGVVMTENEKGGPRSQLYLIFSDSTSFEFWVDSDRITTASCVDQCGKEEIISVSQRRPDTEIWAFPSPHRESAGNQKHLLRNGD